MNLALVKASIRWSCEAECLSRPLRFDFAVRVKEREQNKIETKEADASRS